MSASLRISTGGDNIALKLGGWLAPDRAQRRFSVISFDMDVAQNVKTLRRQVQEDRIVGYVAAHKPDFELANFTAEELAEVAARIDEAAGFDGQPVRSAMWDGVCCCREFEEKYRRLSATKARKLKGQEWGRALARYAMENPKRADDGRDRADWSEIRSALFARISSYDLQAERFMIDPLTFESVPHDISRRRVTSSTEPA